MIRGLLANQKNLRKIAVIEGDKEISYGQLLQKAEALCGLLKQSRGFCAAILLPNCGDYISALWGLFSVGKQILTINALMTASEIFPLLIQAAVTTVVTSESFRQMFEEIAGYGEIRFDVIYIDSLINSGNPSKSEDIFATKAADEKKHPLPVVAPETESPLLLLHTSGTTGKSKIVKLSEKNIQAAAVGYLDKLNFDETGLSESRYILCIPFSSAYGVMILSACLMMSFPIIILTEAFTLGALFAAAQKYRATHYEGSASTILLMEQAARRKINYDISCLKFFGFGGSKISGDVIVRVQREYEGSGFYQGYGMTEASPLITKHPQKDLKKFESVGTAIKGTELAIYTGKIISKEPFEIGEIVVRGDNVMLGYLDDQSETDKAIKEGYLYTGDIGYLDDEGYLFICGRKKNIIIVRGFNVYPEEVESCIQSSLLVKDCIVYGQTDSNGNESICADVVLKDEKVTQKDIIVYLRKHLADYKIPKKIFFVETVGKTTTGKTQRQSTK